MNNLPTEAIWEHSDEIKKKKSSVIRSKIERAEYHRKVSQDSGTSPQRVSTVDYFFGFKEDSS